MTCTNCRPPGKPKRRAVAPVEYVAMTRIQAGNLLAQCVGGRLAKWATRALAQGTLADMSCEGNCDELEACGIKST